MDFNVKIEYGERIDNLSELAKKVEEVNKLLDEIAALGYKLNGTKVDFSLVETTNVE